MTTIQLDEKKESFLATWSDSSSSEANQDQDDDSADIHDDEPINNFKHQQ